MFILFILFLIMSYMLFLIFSASAFMRYELRSNGYQIPGKTFIAKAVTNPYVKRRPLLILPLTRIGYNVYNLYHKLTVSIPGVQKVEKGLYYIGLYFYKSIVTKIIFTVLLLIFGSGALSIEQPVLQLIVGIIAICDFFMYFYCVLQPTLKYQYRFDNHMFINYLLAFNDANFWRQHSFVKKFNYRISIYNKEQLNIDRQWHLMSEYDEDVSVDQSTFKLKERVNPTRNLPIITPIVLSLAVNHNLQSNRQCMGGFNIYQSVDFVKINDKNYIKSNGMMTYLDGLDLIPKGCSLRDVDKNKAFSLRRKSKVPGLYEDSKKVFDRTHLVHHRLSGCEGGIGAMVPMFKSVNTGTNSMFHGKATGTPVKNSMKHYEDFAIDYLTKNPKHSILYVADPFYMNSEDVVPSSVKIKIYRVEKQKVFLLKKGKVINQQYLFDKDKDVKFNVDYQTGHVVYS